MRFDNNKSFVRRVKNVNKCRRKTIQPIPENVKDYLTNDQMKALPYLKSKGVALFAIRRPKFQEVLAIMKVIPRDKYALFLKDGSVDYFPDIKIREQLSSIPFQPLKKSQKEF